MHTNLRLNRVLKILGWSLLAAVLLALLLQPVDGSLLPWDDGAAYAQTGPPPTRPRPTKTPKPHKTPRPTESPTKTPKPKPHLPDEACCRFIVPPGMHLVNITYLEAPPPGIPPLNGEGVIVRIPATLPLTPTQAFIPVPAGLNTEPVGGVITQPIGLINFDFGPPAFNALGTLVVPADPGRDIIVRVEILPPAAAPIPITDPAVIPTDWYIDPHSRVPSPGYIGYGAPLPVRVPGVIQANYEKYAARMGLPPSPIPEPDANTAGVIATLPFTGQAVQVEAVFKIDLYYADNGEKITLHLPELVFVNCYERTFAPYTPVLLRANEVTGRYELPVQGFHRICCSPDSGSSFSRFTAYLLETSTFVVAGMSGWVSPPLPSEKPGGEPAPVILCDHLSNYPCSAVPTPVIPTGLPRTGDDNGQGISMWPILAVVLGLGGIVVGVIWLWLVRVRLSRSNF